MYSKEVRDDVVGEKTVMYAMGEVTHTAKHYTTTHCAPAQTLP